MLLGAIWWLLIFCKIRNTPNPLQVININLHRRNPYILSAANIRLKNIYKDEMRECAYNYSWEYEAAKWEAQKAIFSLLLFFLLAFHQNLVSIFISFGFTASFFYCIVLIIFPRCGLGWQVAVWQVDWRLWLVVAHSQWHSLRPEQKNNFHQKLFLPWRR